MEAIQAGNSWRLNWYFALGAGWCGLLLLVLSWLVLGKPYWLLLLSGETGWAIYPPLSALPPGIPGADATIWEVLVPAVCGGLFLGGWLWAWRQRQRAVAPGSTRWFWWSLLLLLPLLVQLGGNVYAARYLRDTEEQLLRKLQHISPDSTSGAGQ